MSKPDPGISSSFYRACQLVIDIMIRDDIETVEYGQPFRSVDAQLMSAIIMELAYQGGMDRLTGTNLFKLNPSVYRLYYTRYYDRLIEARRKERLQMGINFILAGSAFLSALAAGCSVMAHKDDNIYQNEHRETGRTEREKQIDQIINAAEEPEIMIADSKAPECP